MNETLCDNTRIIDFIKICCSIQNTNGSESNHRTQYLKRAKYIQVSVVFCMNMTTTDDTETIVCRFTRRYNQFCQQPACVPFCCRTVLP
jgi:hypothetical protein